MQHVGALLPSQLYRSLATTLRSRQDACSDGAPQHCNAHGDGNRGVHTEHAVYPVLHPYKVMLVVFCKQSGSAVGAAGIEPYLLLIAVAVAVELGPGPATAGASQLGNSSTTHLH